MPVQTLKLTIYEFLKRGFNKAGYNLVVSKNHPSLEDYESIFPVAMYAPYRTDKQFIDIYNEIKKFTRVDIYRCYELFQLIKQSKKLSGDIIEIGVWRGGTGGLIAKTAKEEEINSNIFLCDTFKGVVKAGKNDPYYNNGEYSGSVEKVLGDSLNCRLLADSTFQR